MYKVVILGGDDRARNYTLDKWKQVLGKLRVVQDVVGIKSVSVELVQIQTSFDLKDKGGKP